MRAKLGRFSALAICVGAAFAASAPAASAKVCAEKIKGAGSSLQKVAQQEVWSKGFEALKVKGECKEEAVKVEYNPTSSGEGLEQWGGEELEGKGLKVLGGAVGAENPFPEFIGTDVGPEKVQIEDMNEAGKSASKKENNGLVTVPVAQSAVTVMISLPKGCEVKEISGKHPRVSSEELTLEWNTLGGVEIEKLIENVTFEAGCKGLKLEKRYRRASPSGTTCGFKSFFADLEKMPKAENEVWKKDTETVAKCLSNKTENWPDAEEKEEEAELTKLAEFIKLKKGGQLAQAVFENPGSIGYADLADALKEGFPEKTKVEPLHENFDKEFKYQSFFVEVSNEAYEKAAGAGASPQEGTESNCTKVEYKPAPEVKVNDEWSTVKETKLEGGGAKNYPICTLTYDLAWHKYSFPEWENVTTKKLEHYEAEHELATKEYLKYIVGAEGQGAKLTELHYGKLPEAIQKKAEEGVKKAGVIEF